LEKLKQARYRARREKGNKLRVNSLRSWGLRLVAFKASGGDSWKGGEVPVMDFLLLGGEEGERRVVVHTIGGNEGKEKS